MAHLIFQTAFPGDVFLSIPLLKNIREWEPGAALTLACRPGLGEFFLENGLVDRVIAIDKRAADRGASGLSQLSEEEWDTVFVPHQSVRTAFWMRQLKARQKVGFHQWWNKWFFTHRVQYPSHLPDALRQLSLLAAVDGRTAERFAEEKVQVLRNSLSQKSPLYLNAPPIPDWASLQVLPHLPEREVVFLAPGSVWATKRWTIEGFCELATKLAERGLYVELVGSAAERVLCDQIEFTLKTKGFQDRVVNRAGETTLNELARLFQRGQALVTNDSGAMHVAAAVGLPLVAVFGPTTLNLGFRPWSNQAVVVQRELSCRPCGKHGHKQCPIKTHACMRGISASEVLYALQSFISR